jgi:hypothetical protein
MPSNHYVLLLPCDDHATNAASERGSLLLLSPGKAMGIKQLELAKKASTKRARIQTT